MTLPLMNSTCKVEIIEKDDSSSRKATTYDKTSLSILLLTLLLAACSISYILYQAHCYQTQNHLTNDEFRRLTQQIFIANDDALKNGAVTLEVQVLDKNRHLLWFRPIDEETNEHEIVNEFENKISREPLARKVRSIDVVSYVVSHQTQFVNCDHFKPLPRGKYLVPPSLHALHTCYQYGVKMDELDRGILKREEGGEFRYNLQDLYVSCHDVFNDQMDELTSQLKNDYEKCKWSGDLDENQQKVIEERFASYFVPSNSPSNLEVSSSSTYPPTTTTTTTTTTTASERIDPRGYVECSHVETEMFEDSFESPSPEALQRCQKFGVTYDELRRGITQNPESDDDVTRLDVGNLYVSCRDVFDGYVEYLTNELKEDYRRCKRMRSISKETIEKIETKFYEALYDEREVTSRRPSTSSSTTTEIVTTMSDELQVTTTNVPPAFANCKRVENKEYYICIKVITTPTKEPVINV